MSEFEHIFHLIQSGRISKDNPEKSKEFLKHSFGILDAWMARSDTVEQNAAWEHTQTHTVCATMAMWWFGQEQKHPQRWKHSWSAEQFVQHARTDDVINIAPESVLARIDWAVQHKDWNFFEYWDKPFVKLRVSRLCRLQPTNPIVAHALVELKHHSPEVFERVCNYLPKDYIHSNISVIPNGAGLAQQNAIMDALNSRNPLEVLSCLEQYTGTPDPGKPLQKVADGLYAFWEQDGYTNDPDVLQRICHKLQEMFPNCPQNVVPKLRSHDSESWKIQANMCRPDHLNWFVAGKTSHMLNSLTVCPNMNQWVEFWADTFALDQWTQEMSNAGTRQYVFNQLGHVDVHTIETNMAPHWNFFEHNATKMGRALAAVVAFLGGHPPPALCDFSNLFDFDSPTLKNYPEGFQQFIQAHSQRNILNTHVYSAQASISSRKM